MTKFTLFETNYTPASLQQPQAVARRRPSPLVFTLFLSGWFLFAFAVGVAILGA